MHNLIITLILIAATIALICVIRLLTALFRTVPMRQRVDLTVYFDDSSGCLEYLLGKMYSSNCFRGADLWVTVVDCIDTEESRKWLKSLRVKLRRDFEIVKYKEGEKCESTGKHQHGDD